MAPFHCRILAVGLLACVVVAGCEPPRRQGAGIEPIAPAAPATGESSVLPLPSIPGVSGLPSIPTLPGLGYPATPQEVFDRAKAAANSNQWQEYVKYLSPDSINGKFDAYMESAVAWDERSIARSPDPRLQEFASRLAGSMQALHSALEARGITRAMLAEAKFNPDAKARLLESIPDKGAFIADVMARGGGSVDGNLLRQFRVENWQVQEHLATVDLVAERNGRELRLPLEVKRIDGLWKLDM